jgi:DNA-directed RNA polymerase specialized sigma24 family protein
LVNIIPHLEKIFITSNVPKGHAGLLEDWHEGDSSAFERLIPPVYGDLRRIAAVRMRSEPSCATLQPTALVHEAYMRLAGSRVPGWENRSHFFGIARHLMRQILC